MRLGENFCPGIVHAVPAKDGLLLRIRVPGGLITGPQLTTVANLSKDFADGTIEITSRANLQIRSVRAADLGHIVEALSVTGLLPSPKHDRVRNIVTSPFAGVDDQELLDPRPLVHELDQRLCSDASFLELHPKFSFAIYGGSRRFSHDRDDVALSAARAGDKTLLQLALAGNRLGYAVSAEHAVDVVLSIAATCIAQAKKFDIPVRARKILEIPGALDHMLIPLLQWLTPFADPRPEFPMEEAPLGVSSANQSGNVNILPSVPLGRIRAEQAQCMADVVRDYGADLRLAPWRGVVLASIQEDLANRICIKLMDVGLVCDGSDGFRGITACAGISGCEASLADVRRDAEAMAQRLAGRELQPGWSVNLSGCEKQCARRHGATVDLIATTSGYSLSVAGRVEAEGCSSAVAVETVAALYQNLIAEVAAQ